MPKRDIEPSLDTLLRDTRRQCRRLEQLMSSLLMRRCQDEQLRCSQVRCHHEPVIEYPEGPRDNGECYVRCRRCGAEM